MSHGTDNNIIDRSTPPTTQRTRPLELGEVKCGDLQNGELGALRQNSSSDLLTKPAAPLLSLNPQQPGRRCVLFLQFVACAQYRILPLAGAHF